MVGFLNFFWRRGAPFQKMKNFRPPSNKIETEAHTYILMLCSWKLPNTRIMKGKGNLFNETLMTHCCALPEMASCPPGRRRDPQVWEPLTYRVFSSLWWWVLLYPTIIYCSSLLECVDTVLWMFNYLQTRRVVLKEDPSPRWTVSRGTLLTRNKWVASVDIRQIGPINNLNVF